LFPRVGFIVTNFRTSSRAVVRFYNKRGMAEQWIKEGKPAVAMTPLSCHRFRANEVRLWLSVSSQPSALWTLPGRSFRRQAVACVMEDGMIEYPRAGTPQGGCVSPILANIYLHEVLDEWFAIHTAYASDYCEKSGLVGRGFLTLW
jgi:hypothetical protein